MFLVTVIGWLSHSLPANRPRQEYEFYVVSGHFQPGEHDGILGFYAAAQFSVEIAILKFGKLVCSSLVSIEVH